MISLGLHVLDDLLPTARHHQAGHTDHLDVHEVPGDGLEDLELRPLNVEDEPVDVGITQSQEERVERQALESDGVRSLLLPTISVSPAPPPPLSVPGLSLPWPGRWSRCPAGPWSSS